MTDTASRDEQTQSGTALNIEPDTQKNRSQLSIYILKHT